LISSRRAFLSACTAAPIALAASRARADDAKASGAKVTVLLPDDDNLQYMSFWFAKAAGYFDEEGVPLELLVPDDPSKTRAWFVDKKPDAAVLPPPMYLDLISQRTPFVLGANLLKNDPIDLVVARRIVVERQLSMAMPLRARLEGLRGLRVGVAPHPPPRLRALFASVGLDATQDIVPVRIRGKDQNDAFAAGRVDALFAHTPFLEHALVKQDAVLIVDQNGGEVKELAERQIHALVFATSFTTARRADAVAMVRAIARAQTFVRANPKDAAATLSRFFPKRDREEVEKVTELYARAIPETPRVRADGFAPALLFYPENQTKPSLEGIDLASYIAPDLVRDATAPPAPSPVKKWGPVVAGGLVFGAALALVMKRRRARAEQESSAKDAAAAEDAAK
jgi:ABC-type nitrate/sulfonate/bicarbonate transport system substrate-binding protein